MTPLERAARALYQIWGSDFDPFTEGEDAKWPEFVDGVRAVLAAIREPSEAMLWDRVVRAHAYAGDVDLVWQAMIDAMMAEKPSPD